MKNLRNKNAPPNTDVVQVYLQSSWDIVTDVYNNLAAIQTLADALDQGQLTGYLKQADIDTLAELNLILNDATLGTFASQAEAEAGTDNTVTMTPLRTAQLIATGSAGIKHNYAGTTDPTVTDDTSQGYSAGSTWTNTTASPHETYRCTDPTAGAAVWIKTTLTTDELATVAVSGDSDDLVQGVVQLLMTAAERTKLATVETNAAADQTDLEIANAYHTQVPAASQAEAEAGTEASLRAFSPLRVGQAITALGGGGGGVTWSYSSVGTSPAAGTGIAYHDLAATVTCTLPTSPSLNDTIWVANNDNSDYNVQVDAGGSNQIREMNVTGLPTVTLNPGDTAILVCQDAGATKKWGLFRMDAPSSAGGGGLSPVFKTASFTAVAGEKYFVDSSGGPVTVTLPAGGAGDNISIMDAGHEASLYNITVNPNGSETIDNDTSFVIDQSDADIDIAFNGSNWEVSADGSPALVNAPIVGPSKTRTVRTLIKKITNTTAGDFDFDNIPSGFDRLIVKCQVRGDTVANYDILNMYYNADTTDANYLYQQTGAYNAGVTLTESATGRIAVVTAASAPANSYSQVVLSIEQPNSSHRKMSTIHFGGLGYIATADAYTAAAVNISSVTAAITRLRLRSYNDPTDAMFGTVYLYGEKDEEIGGGAGFEQINAQTGTTYEFTAADLVDAVTANNAAASTYSIPDSLGNTGGSQLTILNIGAGAVTVDCPGSDTLSSTLNTIAQGEAMTILKTGATTWWCVGGSS